MTEPAMLQVIMEDIKTLIARDSNHEVRISSLERVVKWTATVLGVVVSGLLVKLLI